MASITVSCVPYATNPQFWDRLLCNDRLQYPLGSASDQEYQRAYAPHVSYRDLSLIAALKDQPVAGLQITAHQSAHGDKIGFYGRSALLRLNSKIEGVTLKSAQKALARAFETLCQSLQTPSLDFLEMPENGCLSEFAISLLNRGLSAVPVYKQVIDLTESEEELHRAIRRSNKSQINWGERTLTLTTYDHANVTLDTLERFRLLHLDVAGRQTRSVDSWQLQLRQIMENQAFMITGELDGNLVTASLFLHSAIYCYAGVGASVRAMFDKPLSHAVIWRSVLEAKRRGCRLYDLGERVDLHPKGFSEKERSIADFKRGFGGVVQVQLRITEASGSCQDRSEVGIRSLSR
jgi:hypothetical protein